MKLKTRKLLYKVWAYLIGFSFVILIFLFLFQVVLLNVFYERYKTNQLDDIADELFSREIPSYEYLEKIAYKNGVCISFYRDNKVDIVSNIYNKGCVAGEKLIVSEQFKKFIDGNKNEITFSVINSNLKNKTLVKAIKLGDNVVIFLNVSIEALDTAIILLKNQFLSLSLVIFCLSLVIGYFISKYITRPVVQMNNTAKEMAKGNYEVSFISDSDISEISELSNTLEHAKNELSKIDELRMDLMANVSHDLKTPLTMIKAYAEMTRDFSNQSKSKRDENLNVIISETDKLTLLVNDILELSKLQSNFNELNYEEFSLNKLINGIINRFDFLIKNEGYDISFNEEDLIVKADPKKLEQAIYNLINNAINYTSNKKIVINYTLKKQVARVNIIDFGKGIDKKEVPYIWDKYYHNEKKHKRNAYGTGLGLSIVKNIFESHGFKYGVNSKKGDGTTFYFEIAYINKIRK